MATGTLTFDLDAIARNWAALARLSGEAETTAVVKADAYGLGADRVAPALARAGARRFFVAFAEEGAALRRILGPDPEISVLCGHMEGDAPLLSAHRLTPILSSPEQVRRHLATLPEAPFGLQLNTGMNRAGIAEADWPAIADRTLALAPTLVLSHLACADEPDHPLNAAQLAAFRRMTDGLPVRRSLAATGGILLGPDYRFDLTRPGIGLYGCLPFTAAEPVVRLSLPVVQTFAVAPGDTVGYGATWTASAPARLATVAGGYADGLLRALSHKGNLWHGDTPCPILGRVSMDLITVDVTHLPVPPAALDILGPHQTPDALAGAAGTIGYEILTALGARYTRRYTGRAA
jgi:alanine racemase